jgi:hypothetical protein
MGLAKCCTVAYSSGMKLHKCFLTRGTACFVDSRQFNHYASADASANVSSEFSIRQRYSTGFLCRNFGTENARVFHI